MFKIPFLLDGFTCSYNFANFVFSILDQSCNPVTISYNGFNVTWNKTQVGVTAVAPCTGAGLSGKLQQQINRITCNASLEIVYYITQVM